MAKSLRSKVKRRFRKLIRGYINDIKVKPQTEELNTKCQKALAGIQYREKQKKNAFLFPDQQDAHFPQYKHPPIIDLRSASIPGSGLQWSGASRKKQKIVPHLDEINKDNNKSENSMDNEEQVQQRNTSKRDDQMFQQSEKKTNKKKKRVSKLKKTIVF